MGLFRPTRKVTDPSGREWEIYVLRYKQPAWDPQDYDSFSDDVPFGPFLLADLLFGLPRFLYHHVLVPIWRFLVDLAFAVGRGRRTRTVWIEAISWDVMPHRESILWTTTRDHVARVVDQIAAGLEAGEVVRPLGGTFAGRSSR
jgi:hypothetical protein